MSAILVFEAESHIDLSPLTKHLWQARVPHRVIIENGKQGLWVSNIEDAEKVKALLDLWQKGELPKAENMAQPSWFTWNQILLFVSQYPVVTAVLVILLGAAVITQLGLAVDGWQILSMDNWQAAGSSIAALKYVNWYNFLTPTLIHFGLFHLIMNVFWWWILAREVERVDGSRGLLALFFVLALITNIGFFLLKGPLFGGLSGVNYGLMAWVWFRQARYQKILMPRFQRQIAEQTENVQQELKQALARMPMVYFVPKWLFPFMMVWMALSIGFENAMSVTSNIAHESHLIGAIAGLVLAWLVPLKKI